MNDKMFPVQIKADNRITIPKEIFDKLNMKIGDFVYIKESQEGLELLQTNFVLKNFLKCIDFPFLIQMMRSNYEAQGLEIYNTLAQQLLILQKEVLING